MKWLSALVFTLIAFQLQAQAEETPATIEITSFISLENGEVRNTGAELCGVVSNTGGKHYMVEVTSDPSWQAPAFYMTIPNPEGRFCVVVSTQTGRAQARLIGHHSGENSLATAKVGLKR